MHSTIAIKRMIELLKLIDVDKITTSEIQKVVFTDNTLDTATELRDCLSFLIEALPYKGI